MRFLKGFSNFDGHYAHSFVSFTFFACWYICLFCCYFCLFLILCFMLLCSFVFLYFIFSFSFFLVFLAFFLSLFLRLVVICRFLCFCFPVLSTPYFTPQLSSFSNVTYYTLINISWQILFWGKGESINVPICLHLGDLKNTHVGDHWSVPQQPYIGAPMYGL